MILLWIILLELNQNGTTWAAPASSEAPNIKNNRKDYLFLLQNSVYYIKFSTHTKLHTCQIDNPLFLRARKAILET